MNDLDKVISNGFCIGCGACAFKSNSIAIKKDEYGQLIAQKITEDATEGKVDLCPFSAKENETTIAELIYKETTKNHDQRIGHYNSLLAGHVLSPDSLRANGSSGGMTTWLLESLLSNGHIDGVIHVGSLPKSQDNTLFGYKLSYTIDELRNNSKSKYYPTNFNEALELIDTNKRYAFVGVPCYIKSVRLICLKNQKLKEAIKFFIGIYCGHLKSAAFAELLAWQQGIPPEELSKIDFRVKQDTGKSSNYSIMACSDDQSSTRRNSELYGTDWGLGLFKPKACEWCDDISAETADVVFGDAWLPEYTNDSMGKNIIITRSPQIDEILKNGQKSGKIKIEEISVEKIISSQAANYRHRHEGLSTRIEIYESQNKWHPHKRIKAFQFNTNKNRKDIYALRMKISELSHKYFLEAKRKKSLRLFLLKMLPLELKYYKLNGRLLIDTAKTLPQKLKIFFGQG